jgi:hypothetical protein
MLSLLEKHLQKYSASTIRHSVPDLGTTDSIHHDAYSLPIFANSDINDVKANFVSGNSGLGLCDETDDGCTWGQYSSPVSKRSCYDDNAHVNKTPGLDEMKISSATKRVLNIQSSFSIEGDTGSPLPQDEISVCDNKRSAQSFSGDTPRQSDNFYTPKCKILNPCNGTIVVLNKSKNHFF